MDKFDGQSLDIEKMEREKLQSLFPQCFNEGKLDIDKLLNLCGEYIDNDFEKYKFEWKGKAECFRIAGKRSTGTLRPCLEESVNFDNTGNMYIEGDNLEVLKLLQTSYFRKVKMIYIDPPYNTGKDFVYEDDFKDPMARYKAITSQATKSNPETMGRFHTKWLNMLYPRLRLATNLLCDDGICFISIDDTELYNLKKICDEVFGEENFLATFCWRTDGNFDNQAKVKMCHEYVLMYAKNLELFPAPPTIDPNIPSTSKLFKDVIRNTVIKNGPKNPISGVLIPKEFPCDFEEGIIVAESVTWPQYSNSITVKDFKTQNETIATTGWASKGQLEEFINKNFSPVFDTKAQATKFVITPTGAIESIKERNDIQSHVISVLTNLGGTQKASLSLGDISPFFSFPKPVELIKYLIQMNCGNDYIVLDFFSGSATTAQAVMQLNKEDAGNRKFICVQIPELCDEKSEAYKAGYKNICEIGKERIRRAGKKLTETDSQIELGEEQPSLDVGFRVFKLDTSNLVAWDATPIQDENLITLWDRFDALAKTIKADRSDMDIVFEVMLKMGVPLDFAISEIMVNDKKAYSVGDDCLLLVCLEAGITPEDIIAMCDLAPAKIIAAEESFADDTALSNAHYILRDRDIEMKLL